MAIAIATPMVVLGEKMIAPQTSISPIVGSGEFAIDPFHHRV